MSQGVSLIAVFAVLVVTLVAFLPNLTLGWFSNNTTVTANGMGVKVHETPLSVYYRVVKINGNVLTVDVEGTETEITQTDLGWIRIKMGNALPIGDEIHRPGDSVDFQIKIVNEGADQVTLTALGLAAPASATEESPRTDLEGNQHYLSTELFTSLEGVSDSSCTLSETRSPMYLRVDDTAGEINYFSQLSGDARPMLSKDSSVVLTMKITFEYKTTDQNIFKNFGDYGACQRRLFFLYEI